MFLTKLLYRVAHNLVWFECTHSLIDDAGVGIDERNACVIGSPGRYSHWTGDTNLMIVLQKRNGRRNLSLVQVSFRPPKSSMNITLAPEFNVELMGNVITDF